MIPLRASMRSCRATIATRYSLQKLWARLTSAQAASVGELAQTASMTLPSFMKHIRTLETEGLIRTRKRGRVRTCTLVRERLALFIQICQATAAW